MTGNQAICLKYILQFLIDVLPVLISSAPLKLILTLKTNVKGGGVSLRLRPQRRILCPGRMICLEWFPLVLKDTHFNDYNHKVRANSRYPISVSNRIPYRIDVPPAQWRPLSVALMAVLISHSTPSNSFITIIEYRHFKGHISF